MPFVAEPTYENGELQHGGSDLDLKGSLPYYAVEVIYCLALLQILTALLSDKFWWLLLAVRLHNPAILLYVTYMKPIQNIYMYCQTTVFWLQLCCSL